jgi:ligand-binding sensor domain-containing protein/signal transduction histidine kinase
MNQLRTIANEEVAGNTGFCMPVRPAFALARTAGLVLALLVCVSMLSVSTGWALEPSTPLANLGRQAWSLENGLPQNTVQALVQARDGFVWLGTEGGLVRFDGVGFQVFDRNSNPSLPGNDVCCLLPSGDGGLWIGTSDGLVRWKDGEIKAYSTSDGLPGNRIRSLAQGVNGELWVFTDQGSARLQGGKFVGGEERRTVREITATSTKGTSVLRLVAPSVADELKRKSAEKAGLPRETIQFAAKLNGETEALASKNMLVILHGDGLVTRLTVGKEIPGNRVQVLLADREGSLWIGTDDGLARWAEGKLQRLPVTDPLATASVLTLTEDREGSLWVGTESDGLHILRDQRFRILDIRESLSSDATTAVMEDGAGTLWVGTQENGLNALRKGANGKSTTRAWSVKNGLASDVILSLAAAPKGDVWVGTPDGLNRIRGNRVATFTSIDGLPDDFIRSLLIDADGSLWIGTRRGLTHWSTRNGRLSDAPSDVSMKTYTRANGLGSDLVGAMARDAKGDLWVATLAGLSRLRGGSIANFTTANGLTSNVITALLPRADGTLLIGTQDRGWNVWDGQRFLQAKQNGPEQESIHAILEDGGGHLWFATGGGIARCDLSPKNGSGASFDCAHWIEFGTADGLHSRETATNSHPSAWRSRDGHLWFATPKGLVEVDPANFPVNTTPPPVALERFQVDDVARELRGAASRLKVEAGHVRFEFDYAGLSFVAPLKVRYRYMLEGFDRGWTEAGARRTAYYTNIPPGSYTFRVQAANNDGLWNTDGAALSFELKPRFYQTLWFYALLLAAAIGAIVLLLKRRLYRAQREFSAVLGERSRIAREIHDTLAQGYVGVSVQLEVLAELLRLRKLEEAGKHLNLTREIVREGLAEARQSIWALRTQDAEETTLPVKLRRIAEGTGGAGLVANFSLFGAYRPLKAEMEREVLRIAQEAIHNVKKHAAAGHLWVELEYGPKTITLDVRDDGQGGAVEASKAPLPGHFGLTGMRERAAAIGGELEVTSAPGTGTSVRLRAPAPEVAREQTGEKR